VLPQIEKEHEAILAEAEEVRADIAKREAEEADKAKRAAPKGDKQPERKETTATSRTPTLRVPSRDMRRTTARPSPKSASGLPTSGRLPSGMACRRASRRSTSMRAAISPTCAQPLLTISPSAPRAFDLHPCRGAWAAGRD
jgi:hypothetical protein